MTKSLAVCWIGLVLGLMGCEPSDADGPDVGPPPVGDSGYVTPVDSGVASPPVDAGTNPTPPVDGSPGTEFPDGGAITPIPDAAVPVPDSSTPVPPVTTACVGRTGGTGTRLLTLTSGGMGRLANVHVPDSYSPTTPTELVINLHGLGSSGWQEAVLSGMTEHSDSDGFIVVYPRGISFSWNAGECCREDAVDDVLFISDLIDTLSREYCIDPSRIFATGMSNGGFLTHLLACRLSDRIASFASVSGVIGVDPATCTPSRPIPILQIHGTNDRIVPYEGGEPFGIEFTGIVFRSVAETMEHWRTHNGCAATKTVTYHEGMATCESYDGCAAPTTLCTIEGGGHAWPGGFRLPGTSRDLDATAMILELFSANPMP